MFFNGFFITTFILKKNHQLLVNLQHCFDNPPPQTHTQIETRYHDIIKVYGCKLRGAKPVVINHM